MLAVGIKEGQRIKITCPSGGTSSVEQAEVKVMLTVNDALCGGAHILCFVSAFALL